MKRLFLLALMLCIVAAGCSGKNPIISMMESLITQTPVVIIQTVEVTVAPGVEATPAVEATPTVEATATRSLNQLMTATVAPPANPPKPAATSVPAPSTVQTQLLNSLLALRKEVEAITYDSGSIACGAGRPNAINIHYESIINYPEYDVSGSSDVVKAAYNNYRLAIGKIASSNKDLYAQCKDWIDKGEPKEFVSTLTYTMARQGVDQAFQLINPAIEMLQ